MSCCVLGIDTSNYTTSLALVSDGKVEKNLKLPLEVGSGERGLRQSDAVFAHVKNLPLLFEALGSCNFEAVGVSARPRDVEGSYMPCFLTGYSAAKALSETSGVPCFCFSHQAGHIMACLYSCRMICLASSRFLAFHVSGGTTELLLVDSMNITKLGGTVDLNAGQLIDRVGVKLGLDFPCGRMMETFCAPLEEVECMSCVRGLSCNLSGLENKACDMIDKGVQKEKVAAFVIKSVLQTVDKLTSNAICEYGNLPIVYAGGVMSNKYIRDRISKKYKAYFAEPEYSCDNAAGVAMLAYIKHKESAL